MATAQNDECLIIQLDTPGGLLDSASEIVQKFYASKVPTVVYVAPAPARAGSAGVFITMAADVAVMAPHTRIGAAHPVELGASGEVEKTDDVMKKKMENDTASFAQIHRRQTASQRRMGQVRRARKRLHHGRRGAGQRTSLISSRTTCRICSSNLTDAKSTAKRCTPRTPPSWKFPMNAWEHFSQLFLRPEVMFILMLMVIYGIIGELSSPGAILPGVVGAIALILVLYMSAILPVNVTGLVLIGLAVAAVHRGRFCDDARRADGGRHRLVFPRRADAVQQRRAGLRSVAALDHSGDGGHGGCFSFLSSARASARSSNPSAPARKRCWARR